ncbi:hypothetical protein DH2020_003670 [Rehmannia glutinosa]|uniref:Serum response factor-binding protein 1 n=1 Tax=Rehmannia glutinosa TaxID=99300 RepID=A0ABR0XM91_REHGL
MIQAAAKRGGSFLAFDSLSSRLQQWRGIRVKVRNNNLDQALALMQRKMQSSGIERMIRNEQTCHIKNSEKRVLAKKNLERKIRAQDLARKLKMILVQKVRSSVVRELGSLAWAMEDKRIRLVFKDDDILSETQKSDGLNRSWVLLKPQQHDTVSDVASHLLHVGNNAGNDVEKLKAVEKQPVNSGLLLLASEEFEKEKGGYESDDPEEDDEEDLPQDKKQRFGASGSVANDFHTETNENSLHDGGLTRKKSLSSKEKKDDSNAEDNVENNEETAKLSDTSPVPVPGMKRNVEVQENGKETEDGEIVSKGTKRVISMTNIDGKYNGLVQSRSARRKSVKRRWLKEMKKIQKQNATCESEGLQKWKKHQADAERAEVDEQPKGLPTQNDDGLEQPNQKQGDVHEQPGQKSGGIQEHPNQNCDASGQLNEESDEENEVVPIVIRPGHIRFEPLGKGPASETFQWNGITSKKKGQQWGKENRSFTPRNDYKNSNKEYSETFSKEKEKQPDEGVDFDKLPPLTSMPKIDFSSLIDVRVLKNGSSVPGNEALRQVSEGSIGNENAPKTVLPSSNDKQIVEPSPVKSAASYLRPDIIPFLDTIELSQDKEAQSRTSEIGGVNIWDELGEALNARKEQLSKENGWGKTPKKLQLTYAKKVQPSPASNGGKNAHKVQPSQYNSSGKQSSGGKSWSYKSLRGGGLGQTMAILRSRKDI